MIRLAVLVIAVLMTSCSIITSSHSTLDKLAYQEAVPHSRQSMYKHALQKLGELSVIYGIPRICLQTDMVKDDTGVAITSGAEIPFDTTEMIKTAINSIGGSLCYVQYNPNYIKGMDASGLRRPGNRMLPTYVISGGLVEFDRSTVSRENTFDIIISKFGLGAGKVDTLSQITLDLNLIDYESMAMLPKIQASNRAIVFRGKTEGDVGFAIGDNATFGFSTVVKTIQGRHAAVRSLVELSILQIIGKQLLLPYWRFIPDCKPDSYVIERLKHVYHTADAASRSRVISKLLSLYGFNKAQMDANVRAFRRAHMNSDSSLIDDEVFVNLYVNVPVDSHVADNKFAFSIHEELTKLLSSDSRESEAKKLVETYANSVAEIRKIQDSSNKVAANVQDKLRQNVDISERILSTLENLAKKQGIGEITIFHSAGAATISQGSDEFKRLIGFLDFLARESKGRKILFLSIGSASATGRREHNELIAKKRAEEPLRIISKYLVNIPHAIFKVYGTSDTFSPRKASRHENDKYQHSRIIAVYEEDQIPKLASK